MAWLILASEATKIVNPDNPEKGFTIREIRKMIGAPCFTTIFLADGRRMIVNRDVERESINELATALYHEGRTTARAIRGDVLVGTRSEITREEDYVAGRNASA
jgi:hypothetical protein